MPVLLLALAMTLLPDAAPAKGWEVVGQVGALSMIYVEPAHLKDPKVVAEVVAFVYQKLGKEHAFQIDFFDDRAATPSTLPYVWENRLHQKAKFNFNPKNSLQRFVRLEMEPSPGKPGKMHFKETEEKLPLPPSSR